jgi:hypothetical protein
MTTLVSEMAGLKPRRDSDALNAKSRLMLPRVEPSESLTAKLLVTQQSEAEEPECGRSDLLIQGLVERLPKPNGIWALDDRAKWLRTAASIFDLVYKVGEASVGRSASPSSGRRLSPRHSFRPRVGAKDVPSAPS